MASFVCDLVVGLSDVIIPPDESIELKAMFIRDGNVKSADISKTLQSFTGEVQMRKKLRRKCLDEFKGSARFIANIVRRRKKNSHNQNALCKLRVQRQATTLRCLLCETFFHSPFEIETLFESERANERESLISLILNAAWSNFIFSKSKC
jgi:hypothetical protein